MKPPVFEDVQVVGMHFRGAHAKELAEQCEVGTVFTLQREPDNEYDANAIKVFIGDIHLGYIEREVASFIAGWLDEKFEFDCEVTSKIFSKNNYYPIVVIKPKTEQSEGFHQHDQDDK